jgi:hypothetical protein
MSDFASGFVVWGATRKALLQALKESGCAAFLLRTGRPVVVFPRDEHAAIKVSAQLPGATLVTFSAGDDWGEVTVVGDGARLARLKTGGSLDTAARVRSAVALVSVAARRTGKRSATMERGDAVPASVLGVVGVRYGEIAYCHYEALCQQREHPEPDDDDRYLVVDASGRRERFTAEGVPVPIPRTERSASLSPNATAEALLLEMRSLDPARATPAARGALEQLAVAGPRNERSVARKQTVREAAAALLAQSIAALPEAKRRVEAKRLADALLVAEDATVRGLLAQALRRVGNVVEEQLRQALLQETDAAAARRQYEALRALAHDPTDPELLATLADAGPAERKGAYALLEQSASHSTLKALEARVGVEKDRRAKAMLVAVVATLRADHEE